MRFKFLGSSSITILLGVVFTWLIICVISLLRGDLEVPFVGLSQNQKQETFPNIDLVQEPILETLPPKAVFLFRSQDEVSAKSYLIYDLISNEEVFSFQPHETYPPASLTKIVSALLFQKSLDLEKIYDFQPECSLVLGQKIGIFPTSRFTGKDLLDSSLIYSAGDAVCVLQKSLELSLEDLNNYSQHELGMKNSYFTNFIGLDYTGNYSTAYDMLLASLALLKDPVLKKIVSTKELQLSDGRNFLNTNKLLQEIDNSTGIKTGTTLLAKENLIYRYTDLEKMQDFLIIVLNSENRYEDTKTILKGIYESHKL